MWQCPTVMKSDRMVLMRVQAPHEGWRLLGRALDLQKYKMFRFDSMPSLLYVLKTFLAIPTLERKQWAGDRLSDPYRSAAIPGFAFLFRLGGLPVRVLWN